jgi:hypothetical protein
MPTSVPTVGAFRPAAPPEAGTGPRPAKASGAAFERALEAAADCLFPTLPPFVAWPPGIPVPAGALGQIVPLAPPASPASDIGRPAAPEVPRGGTRDVQIAEIAGRIAATIETLGASGRPEIRLGLDLGLLGRTEVDIVKTPAGTVEITFHTESPQAGALLARHADALRGRLEERGIATGEVRVQSAGEAAFPPPAIGAPMPAASARDGAGGGNGSGSGSGRNPRREDGQGRSRGRFALDAGEEERP